MGFREELAELIKKYTVMYSYSHDTPTGSIVLLTDGQKIIKNNQEWWEVVAMFYDLRKGAYLDIVDEFYVLIPETNELKLIYSSREPEIIAVILLDITDPNSKELAKKVRDAYTKTKQIVDEQKETLNKNSVLVPFKAPAPKEYSH